MKKLSLAAVCSGLLFVSVCVELMTAPSATAQSGTSGKDVRVINTTAEAVPVNVTQLPAVQVGNTPTVNVGNTPTVNVGNTPSVNVNSLPAGVSAAGGDLDITFDADGRVTTDFGSNLDEAYAVAIQPNGKIVAAGNWISSVPNDLDFALARYNPDGSLDTSFNGDGKVTTDFSGFDDRGQAVAIQTDGKTVVAGLSLNGNDYDIALARYNNDGSPDTSFDGDGKVTTDFFNNNDAAKCSALSALSLRRLVTSVMPRSETGTC